MKTSFSDRKSSERIENVFLSSFFFRRVAFRMHSSNVRREKFSPFTCLNDTVSECASPVFTLLLFVQLKGDKVSGDLLEFWKVCPKNIRSEEEEAGAGGGGVGDKDVAAGDLLAKEHFLSQLFKAGGDCI